jgi:hypothetical protein
MTVPHEPSDDELLNELKRVRSDLGFRQWISLRVRLVAALVAFDLIVSMLSIAAVIIAGNAQHSACSRDNDLRAAYTAQWQPLLDQAVQKADPEQADLRARFQTGLDGFKQHPCPQINYARVGVYIVIVVVVLTGIALFIRWLVLRRRVRT